MFKIVLEKFFEDN